MVGPCPALSFLTPKLKPLKSTAPRVDAPARRLLKLPEFNWGQITIVLLVQGACGLLGFCGV